MMGLAKIGPNGWAYYARDIAGGMEDYYSGHNEESGRWSGSGTDSLGLSGEVDGGSLSRLFGQGVHPVTGDPLGRPFARDDKTVAGYALSFSPPKSVSILWALAPDEISDQVRAAHDMAVASALEFLEDHAGFCRRGHAGMLQEATGGYVAAVFVHRTSRAGDPQLHSHVLVANKVEAASDGKWLTLDGRELYEVQKAAGMLYKACLRAELTARLGVSWTEVDDNGGAEIVGVPDRLIDQFSKRRAQVEATAAHMIGERETLLGRSLTGDERAAVFQLAAYQSRAHKTPDDAVTTRELKARWRAEAAAVGNSPQDWSGVFASSRSTRNARTSAGKQVRSSLDQALVEVIDRLEHAHSTWGRAQVVEALSVVLPAHRAGSAEQFRLLVETAADMVLTHPDIVLLTCPDRPDVRHGGLRYSTWWTVQTEQAVLDVIEAGRTAGVAVASTYPAVADAHLGADQAEAVRRIVSGGERVAVMVGPAGSGKSRTLGAARQAWQQAGIPVRGVAPSAVAAGVLTEQAGIASDTLAKFLLDIANRNTTITAGEVIVCDEASMVSTRDLARLVLVAETANAKVVLVGDHQQLGSVDAGGLFRLLAADAKTVELTTVRRFADPWEAQATRRLRKADRTVIDEYIQQRRVSSGEREQALDQAHQAWKQARQQGQSVVVMAADHDTVDQLAMRARAACVHTGEVEPIGITVGNQTVGVGDEIVTLENDRRLVTTTGAWVRNGDRWKIEHRTPSGALHLRSLDHRGVVTVPATYTQDGHVALAYAVTVHRSQGLTVDQAVLVVDRATTAEHLYVGMTRGRHHNQACVITELGGDEHSQHPTPTLQAVLAAALRRTSAEKSATETLRDELDHLQPGGPEQAVGALIEALQQTHHPDHGRSVRGQSRKTDPIPAHSPIPITPGGPEL